MMSSFDSRSLLKVNPVMLEGISPLMYLAAAVVVVVIELRHPTSAK